MAVETITSQGTLLPFEPHASNNLLPQNLEFTRIEPLPQTKVTTAINLDHIKMIGDWERNVWGEKGRPFCDAVGQLEQELSEERAIWIRVIEGETNLADVNTIHDLRAEIGDGLISGIGILRSIYKRDDIKAAGVLHKILSLPSSKDRAPENNITLYNLKAQQFIDQVRRMKGKNPHNFKVRERDELVVGLGGVMRSGISSLESLDADPGKVVADKHRIMTLKYSGRPGTIDERKRAWDSRHLPIIIKEGVVFQSAA